MDELVERGRKSQREKRVDMESTSEGSQMQEKEGMDERKKDENSNSTRRQVSFSTKSSSAKTGASKPSKTRENGALGGSDGIGL